MTRITVDPNKMGGVPCIRGLRIPVATVVAMIADRMSEEEIFEVYQQVPTAESIETLAMAYAQAGRFAEAIEWQQHLIDNAQGQAEPAMLERLRGNLGLYRDQRVCCVGE